MHDCSLLLEKISFPPLRRGVLDTLQVNLGYRCNQQCVHCHVNAGPNRKEQMTQETIRAVLDFLRYSGVETLDLTGGAPEMNPGFRGLVVAARSLGVRVIDRCNLTILGVTGYAWLAPFLAEYGVEVTASLPCYLEDNVDRQRGKGVFESSIQGLRQLNSLGFGAEGSSLKLNLVYNPQGPVLPPAQVELQAAYKSHLKEHFGIVFNELYTLTNMPIQRFGSTLVSKDCFDDYMSLLKSAFRAENLETVMCRSLLSVDYQGYVYDCDFNQMLGLPIRANGSGRLHLSDLPSVDLEELPIVTRGHCYGCTAGQGSSCGGALE